MRGSSPCTWGSLRESDRNHRGRRAMTRGGRLVQSVRPISRREVSELLSHIFARHAAHDKVSEWLEPPAPSPPQVCGAPSSARARGHGCARERDKRDQASCPSAAFRGARGRDRRALADRAGHADLVVAAGRAATVSAGGGCDALAGRAVVAVAGRAAVVNIHPRCARVAVGHALVRLDVLIVGGRRVLNLEPRHGPGILVRQHVAVEHHTVSKVHSGEAYDANPFGADGVVPFPDLVIRATRNDLHPVDVHVERVATGRPQSPLLHTAVLDRVEGHVVVPSDAVH
mmetsp:Transcript_29482/g.85620  ORF Transcript_29482/g.85620 Transcript_29482/m.85620 type:complete len:286 (-) Transcript_29482:1074-1931(-)